jgi:hypothetical protein
MGEIGDFDLDTSIDDAWEAFEAELGNRLLLLEGALVLNVEAGDAAGAPYVQFATQEEVLRVEVSSNTFLAAGHQLGREAHEALVGLGFGPPEEDEVNWHLDAPHDHAPEVAAAAVSALRSVLSVPHPVFVVPTAADPNPWLFVDDGDEDDDEPDSWLMAVIPSSPAHLRELVDATLAEGMSGEVHHDEDDEVPLIVDGVHLFVRVIERSPDVVVFTEVVRDIGDLDRAPFEVGVLNRDSTHLRYLVYGDRVFARVNVQADPYVPGHLRRALREAPNAVRQAADDLAVRLQATSSVDAEG